jgi:hypothetical protein
LTVAPLSSIIVSIGLIPVAFLFVHAFLSGRKGKKFHAVSGFAAIVWDLTLSIGYMLFRSFGGAVDGSSLQLNQILTAYFAVHGAVAVAVMAIEVSVLGIGVRQLQLKQGIAWHGKLTKILFGIWWFAFLSGELFFVAMYIL